MAEDGVYAIVQWEDKYVTVINLDAVKVPRKPLKEYTEGEYVTALYGKAKYRARISEISGDRNYLTAKQIRGARSGDKSYPLKYEYDINEDPGVGEHAYGSSVKRKAMPLPDLDEEPRPHKRKENDGNIDLDEEQRPHKRKENDGNIDLDEEQRPHKRKENDGNIDLDEEQRPHKRKENDGNIDLDEPRPHKRKENEANTEITSKLPSSADPVSSPCRPEPRTPTVDLSSSCSRKKLEKRVNVLEKEVKELRGIVQSISKKMKTIEEKGETSKSMDVQHVNADQQNFEELMAAVSYINPGNAEKDVNLVLRKTALQVFSRQELLTCTRTGKKTLKAGDTPKPALDSTKFGLVERVVLSKCTSVTKETFNKKFDNLLKMERRLSLAQSTKEKQN